MNKDEKYQKLLKISQDDPNIVGFVLLAGRGKGVVTDNSDYDVAMIVKDEVWELYTEQYEPEYKVAGEFDLGIFSISGFRKHADWGTEKEWDRYNFAHLKAQVDKTGDVQKFINEKGAISAGQSEKMITSFLDNYINYYYRSLKNFRDGNNLGGLLDAAQSVPPLITILFALEGRMWPYNKYLEWELKNYPLQYLPWNADEFLQKIVKIVSTGDIETQKDLFQKAIKLFRDQGFGAVIDGWKGYYLG